MSAKASLLRVALDASDWLQGFAYRVSLPFWLFLVASAFALLIAWATVGTQCGLRQGRDLLRRFELSDPS